MESTASVPGGACDADPETTEGKHLQEVSAPDEKPRLISDEKAQSTKQRGEATREALSTRPALDVPGPKEIKEALRKLQKSTSDEFQRKHRIKGASGNQLAKIKYGDFLKIFADFLENEELQAGRLPPESLPCNGEIVILEQFQRWRRACPDIRIAHIKGFGNSMGNYYLDDALAELEDFDMIAFDGDPYAHSGFTALVSLFLRLGGAKRALAFKMSTSIKTLKQCWDPQNLWAQMVIISVDKEKARSYSFDGIPGLPKSLDERALSFYLLGRTAIKATDSKHVLCLGGGGIAGWEAQATLGTDVIWTVFAQSRGRRERHGTLMDWAAKHEASCGPGLRLVRGRDPHEAEAFMGAF